MKGSGEGWVTAEYSMLPGSTPGRANREAAKGKQSGRTQEIQRLIGRSLRSVVDMNKLGERQIILDCDALQADGGTHGPRQSAVPLLPCTTLVPVWCRRARSKEHPITDYCAAISVGIIDGEPRLDLPYIEDANAEVDMNVVMLGSGSFIEVQGTAEGAPFSRSELDALLGLAEKGIAEIIEAQKATLQTAPEQRD